MKLYYAPGTCSLAVHIVLLEAGLPFTPVRVDLKTHRTEHGDDYLAINPRGQVPLLELEPGAWLGEGPVIAQYVADRAANHALMPPPGSLARYRVMEWQNHVTSDLHKGFGPLFNPQLEPSAKAVLAAALQAKLQRVSARLGDGPYLTGDSFSAADAYLYTVVRWAGPVRLDLSGCEHLQRFMARVAARPTVRAALAAEGLPA